MRFVATESFNQIIDVTETAIKLEEFSRERDWDQGRCVFVGDAKYKKVSVRGIKNPDIYQMLAYTTAANLPSGLLIYAKGEAPSASHSIPLAGKTIEVRTLDLDGTPENSLRQIDEIAYKVRSLAGQHRRSAA